MPPHPPKSASAGDRESIKGDEHFVEGDFTLVSSDGVSFKVPSDDVFSLSPVFKDAGTLCDGERTVTFTDEAFENADTIRSTLTLHTKIRLPEPIGCVPADPYLLVLFRMVKFLQKYNCQRTLLILAACANGGQLSASDMFVVGVFINNVKLCQKAVKLGTDQTWTLYSGHRDRVPVIGSFDYRVAKFPFPYLWAITRAIQ